MQLKLHISHHPSYGQWTVYVLLAVALWGATYAGAFHTYGMPADDWVRALAAHLHDGSVGRNVACLGLALANAVLLSLLTSRFAFVDTRTQLPAITFLLLATVWEPSHAKLESYLALLLFTGALFRLLDMRRDPAASEKAFSGSLLIACAGLLINDLMFLIPICWLGFLLLQSFSLRTWLASLMGAVAPWMLYGAGLYAFDPPVDWGGVFRLHFSFGFSLDGLMLPTKLYIGLLFVLFFITLAGTYTDFQRKSDSTRRNLNFILMILVFFLLAFLAQAEFDGTLFPFIALCFSLFISNVYSIRRTNFYAVLYLVFLGVNLLFLIFNFVW